MRQAEESIPVTEELLREIVERLRAAALAPGLTLDAERFSGITPFAVELRHDPNFWPDLEKAADALAVAEDVVGRVTGNLPPPARP